MAAPKTNESKLTTVEGQVACDFTTTHVLLAIPLTLDENGKLGLPASPSGKTLQVATTHGNVNTGSKIKGAAVFAGVNVYLRND